MNLLSHSTHLDPTGTPLSLRLATLSILLPLITTTAFSIRLPSAGLMTVPPTREIFWAKALFARAVPIRKRAIRFINEEYRELFHSAQFDQPHVRVARNRHVVDVNKILRSQFWLEPPRAAPELHRPIQRASPLQP